jgi:hypothetical protein
LINRRILIGFAAAVAATGAGLGAGPALAATGDGGVCTLHGAANFTPNGPGAASTFGYSFAGDLANCQSNAGAPASGTIGAGQVVTETVTLTTATGTTTGTAKYQEPLASGTGAVPGNSCAVGDTSGTSVVTWADKTATVISYTTQSAGAGVKLTGTVIPSLTAKLVAGTESVSGATAPATAVISSTNKALPVGDSAGGLLAFEVADPTQCTTANGVTTAGIDGAVAVGSVP